MAPVKPFSKVALSIESVVDPWLIPVRRWPPFFGPAARTASEAITLAAPAVTPRAIARPMNSRRSILPAM